MKFGFGDEAGDTGGAHGSSNYLVVGIVLTDDPQHLRRIIPRVRKGLNKKLKQVPEFKAYHTPRAVLTRLLRKVDEQDVEIIVVVWRKAETTRLADPEDGYRRLCALAVRRCLERHSRLSLVLDKRYTNPKLRDLLAAAILDDIEPQAALVLQQHESHDEQALQVADAVTWAIFQKYERGDETLLQHLSREGSFRRGLGGNKKLAFPGSRFSPFDDGIAPTYIEAADPRLTSAV